MKKGLLPIGIIVITVILIAGFFPILPSKIVIQSKGTLSLENHIALAAQAGGSFSNGEPLPQQIAPILGRGGLPIVSVTYADPASDSAAALTVIFQGMPTLSIPKSEFSIKPGEKTMADVEARLNATIQKFLEIRAPLASFPDDDPVKQGVLLDNERVEHVRVKIEQPKVSDNVTVPKVSDNVTVPNVSDNVTVPKVSDNVTEQVQDNLVIALGYGAVHIYSLSPLSFTTQFNGLDAGPISGEWWQ